jgi:hypothetical protein
MPTHLLSRRTFAQSAPALGSLAAGLAGSQLYRVQRRGWARTAGPVLPLCLLRDFTPAVPLLRVPRSEVDPGAVELMLDRLRPRRTLSSISELAGVVHSLRLWGACHTPRDGTEWGGEDLLACVMQNPSCRLTVADPPRYAESPFGTCVFGEPHTDKIASVSAELGLPLSTPLYTEGGPSRVRALLQDCSMRFNLRQAELPWSAIALASCAPPRRGWSNKFSEAITMDAIVGRLLALPWGQGTCYGIHNLYAIAYVLNVDRRAPILSAGVRDLSQKHLWSAARLLEGSQYGTGLWASDWHLPPRPGRGRVRHPDLEPKNLLRATGHHLEWMALSAARAELPRSVVTAALRATVKAINAMGKSEIDDGYNPLTHAARAVCLLLGIGPGAASPHAGGHSHGLVESGP